jgi:hypothetical protein
MLPSVTSLPAGAFFSRFWGSLPSTFKIFRPWKKSSTKKSWPTFCDQYFWKFPIWNSCTDEKRREIRMVKVNVIFNDIRLLICLTPLLHCTFDRNKKFSSASKVVQLVFAQRFITIFNCRYHTSNHLGVCHKPTSLSPINCQSVDNCCIIINTLINLHVLEIPHLELPRWWKTPRVTNGKGV